MIIRYLKISSSLFRNKNLRLDKSEFLGFLHPEVVPHMSDILVTETMGELDKVFQAFYNYKIDLDMNMNCSVSSIIFINWNT